MDNQANNEIPATMADIDVMAARIADIDTRVQFNEERNDSVPQQQIFAESAGNNIGKMVLDCAILYGYSANPFTTAYPTAAGQINFTVGINDSSFANTSGAITLPPGRYVIFANTDFFIDDTSPTFTAELLASSFLAIYEDGVQDANTVSTGSFWQSGTHVMDELTLTHDVSGDANHVFTPTGTLGHWQRTDWTISCNVTTFKVANYSEDTVVTFRSQCGVASPGGGAIGAAPVGKTPTNINFKCMIMAIG